jgi:hypothetical protein
VKKNNLFKATLKCNTDKGGAWLAIWTLTNDQDENVVTMVSAWKNASAAKRWFKEQVQANTPRKSIKMLPGSETDAKGKPVAFEGELTYKG